QPANPYDLRAERALSRQDVRQRLVLSALFDLPLAEAEEKGSARERSDLVQRILGHMEVAPLITLGSGRPVNALTGADEERSLAFPLTSRPLGLARNSLHTPHFFNVDLRVVKYIPFEERRRLDFVVELFNLFNHPNVLALNPFYGSLATSLSTFGGPLAFAAPRQVRLSIDLEF
ncbi:MAG TPA: hypothetical protein VFQ43_01550, partial [Nitrososphaera sp.]|nr:hypothetical protein [Nitrososphaera sp.]